MSGLRRSTRIKNGPEIDYNISEDRNKTTALEAHEQDHLAGDKRKITGQRRPFTSKRSKAGGSKTNREELEENFNGLSEEFVPAKFFDLLAFESASADDEFSLNNLVNDWLDIYEASPSKGRKEIVNLILNCCGSLIMAEEHDVNDTTNAETTVAEFEIFFKKQGIFEFYLYYSKDNDKKSKNYKNLYDNFRDFFKELVIEADKRGLIAIEIEDAEADDETLSVHPLIFDLLIWLSKFGSSNINPFRFVSTIALYEIQLAVIQLIPSKNSQAQSLSNMITKETKRKRKNQKAVDNWNEKLQSDLTYINILKSIVDDALAACFEHRVRDTDENIRSISIQYLEKWIKNFPSKFYHANYLKCFGWLLADVAPDVKCASLLSLSNTIKFVINKNTNIITPLETFVRKYLSKIIDIVINDKELECRILAGEVINLVNELGWVNEKQSLVISSLIFMTPDSYQIRPRVGAKNKESRFLSTTAKFFFNTEHTLSFGKTNKNQFKVNESFKAEDNEILSDEESYIEDDAAQKNIENSLSDEDNAAVICKFIKFFLDAFTCFVAVSTGVSSYDTFDIKNSQCEIDTFVSYQDTITQAMEFLSPKFKKKLFGLARFIVIKDDVSNNDFLNDFAIESIIKTDLLLLLLHGFCKGLYEQNKDSSNEFAPYFVQFLPKIVKLYITSGAKSSQIALVFQTLSFFTHEQFSNDSLLDEITASCQKAFFGNMIIRNDDLIRKNAFTALFLFYKKNTSSRHVSYWRNETQVLLDKAIAFMETTVFVNPKEYPETNFDSFTKELFLLYINKLVILLRFFSVELPSVFWTLFEKTILSNVASLIDELQESNVVNFEIYFVDILKHNAQLQTSIEKENSKAEVQRIVTAFTKIKSLFSQLYHIEYDDAILKDLRLSTANTLLDIVLFYESTTNQTSTENIMIEEDHIVLDNHIYDFIKDCFSYQEMKVLNAEGTDDDQYQQEIMNLCTFVLKIKNVFIIQNKNLKHSTLWQRILLKKERLGPDYVYIVS